MQRRTRAPPAEETTTPGLGREQQQQQQQQQQSEEEEGRDQKKTRSSSSSSSPPGAAAGAEGGASNQAVGSSGGDASGSADHRGQQSFLSSIFLHLAEAREELESLAASKGSGRGGAGRHGGGGSEREEQAVRVRLERCLGLVRGVIRGAPGVMTPAHSNRGVGLPWEVTVSIKPTGAAKHHHLGGGGSSVGTAAGAAATAATSTVSMHAPPPPLATGTAGGAAATTTAVGVPPTAWTSGPPERYVLELHPLETVRSLRTRVAATNGMGLSADYTRLLLNGKAVQVDSATVAEAGIRDGSGLWTLPSSTALLDGMPAQQAQAQHAPRPKMDEAARRAGRGGGGGSGSGGGSAAAHDGDVIAEQDGPFEELFRLLECAHGLEVSESGGREGKGRDERVLLCRLGGGVRGWRRRGLFAWHFSVGEWGTVAKEFSRSIRCFPPAPPSSAIYTVGRTPREMFRGSTRILGRYGTPDVGSQPDRVTRAPSRGDARRRHVVKSQNPTRPFVHPHVETRKTEVKASRQVVASWDTSPILPAPPPPPPLSLASSTSVRPPRCAE